MYFSLTPLLIVDSWKSKFCAISFIFIGLIYFSPFSKKSFWFFTISWAIFNIVDFLLSILLINPVAEFNFSFIKFLALSSYFEFFKISL